MLIGRCWPHQPGTATSSLEEAVRGDASDALALAPRTGRAPPDVSAAVSRPPADFFRGAAACRAARTREPKLGIAGITTNPEGRWVTQQGRNLLMELDDAGIRPRFLIRDRDRKFCRDFDEVFRSEGICVIKAPARAPRARAHAERWVGSIRRERLDRLLILGRRHLNHTLATYVLHYNQHRPHRALAQHPPIKQLPSSDERPIANAIALDRVRRRDLLGGLIHEYRLAA
jgi:hypothetical protein